MRGWARPPLAPPAGPTAGGRWWQEARLLLGHPVRLLAHPWLPHSALCFPGRTHASSHPFWILVGVWFQATLDFAQHPLTCFHPLVYAAKEKLSHTVRF